MDQPNDCISFITNTDGNTVKRQPASIIPDSDVPSGLPPGTMVVAVTAEPPGRPPPGRADATVSRDHLDPLMLAETVRDIRERKGRR